MSVEEAAAGLSGARVAFGGRLHSRKSLGFVEALIESEAEGLDLLVGHGGMEVDLLVGAGAVSSVHRVYVGCDPFGPAPFYKAAVREGRVRPIESSEYMTIIGMRAAALGVSFLPSKAVLGSDLEGLHDLCRVTCPYTGDVYMAIPRIQADVAVIHANAADEHGNVLWPEWPERALDFDIHVARCADRIIVTVEEIVGPDVVRERARETKLFAFEVDGVVLQPRGAWPTACAPYYGADTAAIRSYLGGAEGSQDSREYVRGFLQRRHLGVLSPGVS